VLWKILNGKQSLRLVLDKVASLVAADIRACPANEEKEAASTASASSAIIRVIYWNFSTF
jgi:hypothetical protein